MPDPIIADDASCRQQLPRIEAAVAGLLVRVLVETWRLYKIYLTYILSSPPPEKNLNATDLCTEQEIKTLVHAFYAKVRRDEILGPIFNHHIDDWDHHLAKLTDFWSSVLLGTRRFNGTPMPKHVALPDLNAELFQRWLMLFRETTSIQSNHAMGERAYALAQRIARSLWYGYQISHCPAEIPADLAHG